MSTASFMPPLNQVALSVIDLRRTERWYREGLGFLPAGGSRFMMSTPLAGRVQGVPGAASTCWWLVGRNPRFQIEMFQFRRPMARLMPLDARASDIGYRRIGVHVLDFDATLRRLAALGTQALTEALGEHGRRRVCVRDPDGVFVELMEDDPLPEAPASARADAPAVRSVTLSTPDLAATLAYLKAIAGRDPEDLALHSPEHEALWGLPGARCKRAIFRCGDVLAEVVQYLEPLARPWPADYRVCDQGILNIAFGARSRADHTRVFERAITFGARPNCKPLHVPGSGVVYVNDPLGFSVEINWLKPGKADREWGFEQLPLEQRPTPDNQRVEGSIRIAAPVRRVWQVLSDQNAMSRWSGFKEVRRIRDGAGDPDGYGSERFMRGPTGVVVEQITGVEPGKRIRYRVIKGSPFNFHNGEIVLRAVGNATEVDWTVRFRSKIPLLGGLFRALVRRMLNKILHAGLKPYAEGKA